MCKRCAAEVQRLKRCIEVQKMYRRAMTGCAIYGNMSKCKRCTEVQKRYRSAMIECAYPQPETTRELRACGSLHEED